MTRNLALHVIEEALKIGVAEFCVCAGSRNAEFVKLFHYGTGVKVYYWFEERSAAFFALGRAKQTGRPVAVITTSGTAAAEMLPAMIEGYYTGIPLLAITADRPRTYRNTGAPQTIEQVGLYGVYAVFSEDLENEEKSHLRKWKLDAPAHINVCFEDPTTTPSQNEQSVDFFPFINPIPQRHSSNENPLNHAVLDQFFKNSYFPFVVVSALKSADQEAVATFLLKLGVPCYLEGISGLREDPRLQHLRIVRTEKLWGAAEKAGYPIDGVLRIGGVPTLRLWRDLEDKQNNIQVCSISELPFPGLSWGMHIQVPITSFLLGNNMLIPDYNGKGKKWLEEDKRYVNALQALCEEEPFSEPAMFRALSKSIPLNGRIYLGNSLPIREWDLIATSEYKGFSLEANRGMSGIDGQISTFLGWCVPNQPQFAILGDLTTLFDFAGPWILRQLPEVKAQIIVVNNKGGKLFTKLYKESSFQNSHNLTFPHFAAFWNLAYSEWEQVPNVIDQTNSSLIEMRPDPDASARFWKKLSDI